MSAIEASDLTKIYRTYRKERGLWSSVKGLVRRKYEETRAADNISFQIEEGELVGFLGRTAQARPLCSKCFPGFLIRLRVRRASWVLSHGNARNEMKRQFSLLMGQKNALWWDLPAQESLELNRAIYGIDRTDSRKSSMA